MTQKSRGRDTKPTAANRKRGTISNFISLSFEKIIQFIYNDAMRVTQPRQTTQLCEG
jgi:hypothetical protein